MSQLTSLNLGCTDGTACGSRGATAWLPRAAARDGSAREDDL